MTPSALILQFQHLPAHVAQRLWPSVRARVDSWDDLVSVGYVALCRAARDFDPARGVAFKTLGYTYVRHAMLKAAAEGTTVIRVPNSAVADPRCKSTGRAARCARLARRAIQLRDNYCRYEDSRDARLSVQSALARHDTDPGPLLDLRAALARLRPSDRRLLGQLYGIDRPPLSWTDLAKHYGLSHQAIRGRAHKACARLRELLADYDPDKGESA